MKTAHKRESHVIYIFKITLHLYALNISSTNEQILRHKKVSYFELSALSLAYLGFNFLYVSLSCNHSNPEVTRIDKMFSANFV